MSATVPQTDWLQSVLFERGYLARIKGESIKVYLVIVAACGGRPDCSVRMSLRELMAQTRLSCPTVIESLSRLEQLGLVVSTTRERGKVKTYYVPDPPGDLTSDGLKRVARPIWAACREGTRPIAMEPYFFRVEHDLLRSEAFQELGGSAIKVYLVIGLYADFETGWAYPSIRTIARQAGLSRQTVLDGGEATQRGGPAGDSQGARAVDGLPDHPGRTRASPGLQSEATGLPF